MFYRIWFYRFCVVSRCSLCYLAWRDGDAVDTIPRPLHSRCSKFRFQLVGGCAPRVLGDYQNENGSWPLERIFRTNVADPDLKQLWGRIFALLQHSKEDTEASATSTLGIFEVKVVFTLGTKMFWHVKVWQKCARSGIPEESLAPYLQRGGVAVPILWFSDACSRFWHLRLLRHCALLALRFFWRLR